VFVLEKWFIGLPRHFNNLTNTQDEILKYFIWNQQRQPMNSFPMQLYTDFSHRCLGFIPRMIPCENHVGWCCTSVRFSPISLEFSPLIIIHHWCTFIYRRTMRCATVLITQHSITSGTLKLPTHLQLLPRSKMVELYLQYFPGTTHKAQLVTMVTLSEQVLLFKLRVWSHFQLFSFLTTRNSV
jgi:hypothetical protein